MRWFQNNKEGDSPRLLSLSPLRHEADPPAGAVETITPRRSRVDMSPIRWQRRRNSGSHEFSLYNIRSQLVMVETDETPARRLSVCKDTASKEKRNPLLEKVKNTKLSCFKATANIQDTQFNPARFSDDCQRLISSESLSHKTGNTLRRRMASSIDDLIDDQVFLSIGNVRESSSCSKIDNVSCKSVPLPDANMKRDVNGSNSCLSAKIRAMSEKYLKHSTNRLLAKLYRSGSKGNVAGDVPRSPTSRKAKLRSFSYGALPGLDEFQKKHNPLYQEDDDDLTRIVTVDGEDCDSGILVNGSITSSVCGGGRTSFRSDTRTGYVVSHARSVSQDQTQQDINLSAPSTTSLIWYG
uniref:Uncharacterized protein n=1 Tax=Clastoptera arizonana TaxID=38151 RepID=A0A1B6E027_9HEMI